MKKVMFFLFFLLFFGLFARTQTCEPLQPSSSTGMEPLIDFFGGGNRITNVCVLSESAEHIAVRVEYSGFSDKNYTITGSILDGLKKNLPEFEAISFKLNNGSTSVDIQFEFKLVRKTYSTSRVVSKYLLITINESDKPGFELDGVSLFGTSMMYKLDRQWPVQGIGADNSNIIVKVKLTPFKNASLIKPL
ncbi:MAG: hypothetical protein WA004_15215 [Saprospiraceae bacterium]